MNPRTRKRNTRKNLSWHCFATCIRPTAISWTPKAIKNIVTLILSHACSYTECALNRKIADLTLWNCENKNPQFFPECISSNSGKIYTCENKYVYTLSLTSGVVAPTIKEWSSPKLWGEMRHCNISRSPPLTWQTDRQTDRQTHLTTYLKEKSSTGVTNRQTDR